MRFHENCGSNIILSCGDQQAERIGGSYDHGIVYGKQALQLGEIFQLKVKKLQHKWAGALRLGVTTISPTSDLSKTLRAVTDIFNSEHSQHYWIWSGGKVHHNKEETSVKLNLHSLVVNDVVGLQIRKNGELHLYQHGNHLQKVSTGLPVERDFYLVSDVYGQVEKIAIEVTGGTLKYMCRKTIRSLVKEKDIDELQIPKQLKIYLKY